MPAATQPVPSWMTSSTAKDIPLNGVSNGVKSKSSLSKPVVNPFIAALEEDGTLDAAPPIASTNQTFRKEDIKTKDRVRYEGHKDDFLNRWAETGTAIELVFEDLFREKLGISINQYNALSIKIGADDYNTGVRSWNASLPDRKSSLKPLRNPENVDIGGLQVTIEELEAYPDAIKAALLLLLGFDPALVTFPDLFDDDDGDTPKKDVLVSIQKLGEKAGLMQSLWNRSEEENDEMEQVSNDQIKDSKTGYPKLEARLTKQLRFAVGLPAVSVG